MSIYKIKGAPWNYQGAIDVSDCKTSEEVMIKAGLDWQVNKCPAIAQMQINSKTNAELDILINERNDDGFIKNNNFYRAADNEYFTYRTDRYIPLGRTKGKYTIVQNTKAFEFFDKVIGYNAIFDKAGFFGNGERIFVSVKLNNIIEVNKKDPVSSYLVFTNSHDGLGGVKILFTNIRVICENTLASAISKAKHYVSFRHTESVHENLKLADKILGITKKQIEYSTSLYNKLYNIKVKDTEVMEYLCKSVLTDQELEKLIYTDHNYKHVVDRLYSVNSIANISTKKINTISSMYDYYNNGIGQKEIIGTMWGAYGAVTGYYSNVDTSSEGIKRMDTLLYGDKFNKIINSIELALN